MRRQQASLHGGLDQASHMLDERSEMLEGMIATSPLGVVAVDVYGKITVFNEQAERIWGYREDEVLGLDMGRLYSEINEPRRINKELHSSLQHRLLNEFTAVKSKTGEVIPVRLSSTWLHDAEGGRIGSVGYFEDLRSIQETERRQALLLQASNVIANAQTVGEGLDQLAAMVVSLLHKSFCRILLLDEDGLSLTLKAACAAQREDGPFAWDPGKAFEDDWPFVSAVLNRGESVVIEHSDQRYQKNLQRFSKLLMLEQEIHSLLMAPLKIGQRVIGLLDVGDVGGSDRSGFTADQVELAGTIASQAAVLIDHRRELEFSERRRELLAKLDVASESLATAKEPSKLHTEVIRLLAEIFEYDCGALFINRPRVGALEALGVFGLADSLIGTRILYDDGDLSDVARNGGIKLVHFPRNLGAPELFPGSADMHSVAMIALKRLGEVQHVLMLTDPSGKGGLTLSDREFLQRYGVRASLALQTSQLITQEHRVFARLAILSRIGEYLQAKQASGARESGATEKMLHAALTGLTAGYGLGFNRAVLFLREGDELVGQLGIGQIAENEARDAWAEERNEGLSDFEEYLTGLEAGEILETEVGRIARRLRMPIVSAESDAFSKSVLERRWLLVRASELGGLPRAYRELLKPTTEVVVAPLIAREQAIGLITVDNKFTETPVTADDIESLLAFATPVGIAIDNIRLFQHTEAARQKLRSLYEASATLISAKEPRQVLREIVEQTRTALGAAWVRVILIDDNGRAQTLVMAGAAPAVSTDATVREGGVAHRVMEQGAADIFEDTTKHAERLNPFFFGERAMGAVCLPLAVRHKRLGVMWISFNEPRKFPDFEIDALQLYANQAALAYDNARRMEELNHLKKAAEALSGATESWEVLEQIAKSAREVLQADSAAVWSYDSAQNRFIEQRSVADGIPPELWAECWKREPQSGGTAYTVMEQGNVWVEDVSDEQRYLFLGGSTRSLLTRIGSKSFSGLGLMVGEERLGVLYVNYNRARTFTEEEQGTARTFANHAALALKKARLRDQLENARNAALVVAQVTALENLPATLKLIVERTRDAVRGDAVTLYTYDARRKRIGSPPEMDGLSLPRFLQGEVAKDSVVYKILDIEKMYVADDAASDEMMKGDFVQRERIVSSIGVPLVARGEVEDSVERVGVMFVNYRRRHRFTEDELSNIWLFANQAAVAIRNAQLYAQAQEREKGLQALYQAGNVVTASLDLKAILDNIAEQAKKLVSSSLGHANFVHIRLVEEGEARLVAARPAGEMERATAKVSLEDGRIGLIGRAVRTGMSLRVNNVQYDPDFIACHPDTSSELIVLLRTGNKVIGLIDVAHQKVDAFDEEDQLVLEALAAQASIAIENARQFEELNRTKTKLAARTAVAWMGMASAVWGHSVAAKARTIKEESDFLWGELDSDTTPAVLERARRRVAKIARLASEVKDKPVTPVLSPDDIVSPVNLDELLHMRVSRLSRFEPYKSARLSVDLGIGERATARLNSDWLVRALDILIDNAVDAVSNTAERHVTVITRRNGDYAEITVADNGPGIPKDVVDMLFKSQIPPRASGKGSGIGLLMAQVIVQAYGGEIALGSTGPEGTRMCIKIPLDTRRSDQRSDDHQ